MCGSHAASLPVALSSEVIIGTYRYHANIAELRTYHHRLWSTRDADLVRLTENMTRGDRFVTNGPAVWPEMERLASDALALGIPVKQA